MDPLNIKPWVAGAVAGLGFGGIFGVITGIGNPHDWPFTVGLGLVTGLLLAVTMAFSMRNWQRRLAPAVEGLSPEARKAAYRAAGRGPAPAEPEVRAAALEIAEQQLARVRKVQILLVIATVCGVLSAVLMTLDALTSGNDDGQPWWRLWPAVPVVVVLAGQLYQPRQLRRRIAVLRGSNPAD